MPNNESIVSQPEPKMDLTEKVTGGINTLLNQEVGHRIQSQRAAEAVRPLTMAQDLLDLAEKIDSGQELTDDDQSLLADRSSDDLRAEAQQFYDNYEQTIEAQTKPLAFQAELEDARHDYVALLTTRKLFKGRQHREDVRVAEARYNDALTEKIAGILSLDPHHDKAPYSPKTMQELHTEKPTLDQLSGNQLHVLVDQLSREHVNRAELVESMSGGGAKRVLGALEKSRALRVIIGGTLWAGSLVAQHKGFLPTTMQSVGDTAGVVLPIVTGYFTSRELMQGADSAVERMQLRRHKKRAIRSLAESPLYTEQAMRAIYSDIEYQDGKISSRTGGSTKEENAAAFDKIDEQFAQLRREEYRGGKPYSADIAIPYVADILLEHREELQSIVDDESPNEAFVKFSQSIIEAQTAKFTEKQRESRAKRTVYRSLSLGAAIFAQKYIKYASDVKAISGKPGKFVKLETGTA